ncbi:hypothetical protein STANM309S_02695 [Streptomyces tanashiensis]
MSAPRRTVKWWLLAALPTGTSKLLQLSVQSGWAASSRTSWMRTGSASADRRGEERDVVGVRVHGGRTVTRARSLLRHPAHSFVVPRSLAQCSMVIIQCECSLPVEHSVRAPRPTTP